MRKEVEKRREVQMGAREKKMNEREAQREQMRKDLMKKRKQAANKQDTFEVEIVGAK